MYKLCYHYINMLLFYMICMCFILVHMYVLVLFVAMNMFVFYFNLVHRGMKYLRFHRTINLGNCLCNCDQLFVGLKLEYFVASLI